MKKIKILHIADMHFRHMGRLFYSTARKLNNGFILNGYNVLQISDRDILHRNKNAAIFFYFIQFEPNTVQGYTVKVIFVPSLSLKKY